MSLLTQAKINSVDVSSYLISYEVERVFGDAISIAKLKFKKGISTAVTIEVGQTLEIWRGFSISTEEKIFSGYIEKYDPETGVYNVVAKDKMWDLIRKQVNKDYISSVDTQAGVMSEIWKDLVTTYGGLTADSTTVQSSGTVKILEKFRCRRTDIFERCKALATTLDWQQYYRPDTDKAYFEPKGFSTNTLILTVGSNVINMPKWEYDSTELINDLIVTGGFQEIQTIESGQIGVTSGYATTGISLTYNPLSVELYKDTSAITNPSSALLQVGGQPDTSASFFYYVDKPQKKIFPKSGTSFTGNDYFFISYTHPLKIPIHMANQTSIDAYGKYQRELILQDVQSVADAEQRGIEFLSRYSTPFIYSSLKVKLATGNALKVGQLIRVVDNKSPKTVDRDLVITRHRMRYPGDFEEIDVGDKQWRISEWQFTVEERFRRLLEENLQDQDILVELIDADNTVTNRIKPIPRYLKMTTETASGTNLFILGHPTYGILGTNKLGAGGLGAETNHFIMHESNSYSETFIDTDFKDTGTTTATWTTTGSATFTVGQTARSSAVDYNNGTITTVVLTADNSTNLTFFVSANGGTNWESTTSGTTKTFSNTGTDLRWRADASGNATLTSITLGSYH